jgi:tetratricopeptide (TPR) repeat protein
MPSHIFTRIGAWQESIDTNNRSADIAKANDEPGDELHALDYLVYAYLQTARDLAAKSVVERAAAITDNAAPGSALVNPFAVAAIPARFALERGDWAAAASLSLREGSSPNAEAITRFARAIGASRSGHPEDASEEIARLGLLRDILSAVPDPYWAEQVDIQRQIAVAWQLHAEDRISDAIAELLVASDIEEKTDKAAVTPGPFAPARESLAELLLEAGRSEEALAAFEGVLAREPGRFQALVGAWRAAAAAGNEQKAAEYRARLVVSCVDADTVRPALAAAR